MTAEQVAFMTVEELKDLITAVVDERLSVMKTSLLQEIADLIENNGKRREQALVYQEAYVLPKRTKEEQQKINQSLIEWLDKWIEEGDAEEQRETLEYLQKALDEDRLSNRPLFAQNNKYVLPKLTEAEKQQRLKDLDEMFRRWDEEDDEEEQRETFEYLQKALDEDRLSNRPLFPQK